MMKLESAKIVLYLDRPLKKGGVVENFYIIVWSVDIIGGGVAVIISDFLVRFRINSGELDIEEPEKEWRQI